jgi:hypothetical protein
MADFLLNGQANGSVASTLLANDFNPDSLRPFVHNGRKYVFKTNANGQKVAVPAPRRNATLRYEDWKTIDSMVVKTYKERLRAVADFRSRGLQYVVPGGMAKTVLLTETQSDMSPAEVSMDGKSQAANDRPTFTLTNLPLPIIHKDFGFNARQLAASRQGGSPLDLSGAELAARRVAEEAEKLFIGNSTVADQYNFGGGTIYGLTDHPDRNTQVLTAPTATGWTAATLLAEVLAMRQSANDANVHGPFGLYFSQAWDQYLDGDYDTNARVLTLRQRLAMIDGIQFVRTLDYMSSFDAVLVGLRSDVARVVVGMEIVTVQWEVEGGMELRYKVMAILVPQIRSDDASNSGVVHGSTA